MQTRNKKEGTSRRIFRKNNGFVKLLFITILKVKYYIIGRIMEIVT